MTWPEVLTLARRANPRYSLSENAQEMLWKLAQGVPKGGLIVELGVCHGKTAVVLALAAKQQKATYRGIDNWSLEGSRVEVARLLRRVVGPGDWWLMEADTHADFLNTSGMVVDFLLIDAGHDEANVGFDCAVWIPKVRRGGLVAFDDYPTGVGWEISCHEAVRRNADFWTGEWETVASWGATVVRRKPLAQPA